MEDAFAMGEWNKKKMNVNVGANCIRPPMIQVYFPIVRTIAFDYHIICVFAYYLNGYFWSIGVT